MKNSWKRVASGALALAIVASNVTANVDAGGLFGSLGNNNITAKADDTSVSVNTNTEATSYSFKNGETEIFKLDVTDKGGDSGFYLGYNREYATITAQTIKGENTSPDQIAVISKVEFTVGGKWDNIGMSVVEPSNASVETSGNNVGDKITVSNVNSTSLKVTSSGREQINKVTIYYELKDITALPAAVEAVKTDYVPGTTSYTLDSFTSGGTTYNLGTDYKISGVYKAKYENGNYSKDGNSLGGTTVSNAGAYFFDIEGKGIYSGTASIPMVINKFDLNDNNTVVGWLKNNEFTNKTTYNGQGQTPTVYYVNNNTYTPLKKDVDYTVTENTNNDNNYKTSATDAGTYKIWLVGAGNYGGNSTVIQLEWSISPADLVKDTDYKAPVAADVTENDEKNVVYYAENGVGLLSAAGEMKNNVQGSFKYLIVPPNHTYGTADYYFTSNKDDSSEWVDADKVKGAVTGDYRVYYKITGTDGNHNDLAADANNYVDVTVAYAPTTLTLSNLGDDVKVVEVGGNAVAKGDNGYQLTATKSYYIYTDKSIYNSDITVGDTTVKAFKHFSISTTEDQDYDNKTYAYRYELTVPKIPNDGYVLSHNNDFTGKVFTSDTTKLYVADGTVTEDAANLAATLKGNSTYYYGDKVDENSVDVAKTFEEIVKVKKVYFTDSTGAEVDISKVKYGTYNLRAEVLVDNDKNGKFDDKGVDLSYTLQKEVEYKARPMAENNYYLVTGKDDEGKDIETELEVKYAKAKSDAIIAIPVGTDSGEGETATATPELDLTDLKDEKTIEYRYPVVYAKDEFTYTSEEQTPVIVVKNKGNEEIEVKASVAATEDNADAEKNDYINNIKAQTNAGTYTVELKAQEKTDEEGNNTANYTGSVYFVWNIQQADVSEYIVVKPNNNVVEGTGTEKNAIVYDGEKLDKTDFLYGVEAVAENDNDEVKAKKALAQQLIKEMTAKEATETEQAVEANTSVGVEGKDYTPDYTTVSTLSGNTADNYLAHTSITIDTSDFQNVSGGVTLNLPGNSGYTNTFVLSKNTGIQAPPTDLSIDVNGTLTYTRNSNDEGTIREKISVSLKDGCEWYFIKNSDTMYTVTQKSKPTETYDIKSAGEQKADVTLTNDNFVTVKKDVGLTIAKREVTLTPDEGQFITYRDTKIDLPTYTVETSTDDEGNKKLTGVIEADKALFQKPAASSTSTGGNNHGRESIGQTTTSEPIYAGALYVDKRIGENGAATDKSFEYVTTGEGTDAVIDYTKAVADGTANGAGKYTYAGAQFDNYVVKLPETYTYFEVKPLDIAKADLAIILKGITASGEAANDWKTQNESGYVYDGTTKYVDVEKVYKAGETYTVTFTPDDDSEINGFTLNATKNADNWLIHSEQGSYVTVPAGKTVTKITVYGYQYNNENNKIGKDGKVEITDLIVSNNNVNDYISFSGKVLEANNYSQVVVTKVEVEYKTPDEYVLSKATKDDNGNYIGDYIVGGTLKAAGVGTYYVQVKGVGNYTGVAQAEWNITEAEVDTASIKLNLNANEYDIAYEGETYNGKAVTAEVVFENASSDSYYQDYADIEIKYYKGKYDNKEALDSAIANGATAEVTEPTNAGEYTAVATITCQGYKDQTLLKPFTIQSAKLTVAEGAKNKTYKYGTDKPVLTIKDLDSVSGFVNDADKETVKKAIEDGKLVLKWYKPADVNANVDYYGQISFTEELDKKAREAGEKVYAETQDSKKASEKYREVITEELGEEILSFMNNYWFESVVWVNDGTSRDCPFTLTEKARSINSEGITIVLDNDTVVLDDNGFVNPGTVKVYDNAFENEDEDADEETKALGKLLTADTDYELNITTTATAGPFEVEIVGKGKYTGTKTQEYTVVSKEEAAIKAIEEATKLEISEPTPTVNASGVGRVTVTATREVEEGFTIKETGFIYVKDTSVTDELIIKNVDTNGISKNVAQTTNGSKTLNITDSEGKGARVVAYAVVSDGTYEATIYTNEVSATYEGLKKAEAVKAIEEATKLEIFEPTPTVNASGVGRVTVTGTREVAEGFTIKETGFIYVKDTSVTDDLILNNVGTNGISKNAAQTTNGSKTLNITDPDGKGARVVAYAVVSDGTYETTIYTNEVSATYAKLFEEAEAMANIESATTLTLSEPKATVNASGVGRVTVTASRTVEDDYIIEETGFIYVKDTSIETSLTLENVGTDEITKNLANTTNGSKTLNITDPDDKGVRVVAYITVSDGTYSKTIYTDEVSAKYSKLSD